MTDMWGDLVWAALADLQTRLLLVLPGILAMLTLAVVGLVGAWICARVARRVAQAVSFDRRAETWGIVAALHRAGVRKPPSANGRTCSGPSTLIQPFSRSSLKRSRPRGPSAASSRPSSVE